MTGFTQLFPDLGSALFLTGLVVFYFSLVEKLVTLLVEGDLTEPIGC